LALIHDEQGQIPFSSRIVELWWQAHAGLDENEREERTAQLFSILEGLGYDIPAESRALLGLEGETLLPDSEVPGYPQYEPKAMALINVIKKLGKNGSAQANADDLKDAIGELDEYGMTDAARALAVEALTGSRL
jgi:hypothetical protein